MQEVKDRKADMLETWSTIILALAALAISWCSYQSTLWEGIQIFRLAEMNKYNRLAQEKSLTMLQHQTMDENLVIGFVRDYVEKNQFGVEFNLKTLRPELAHILKAWTDTDPLNNPAAPPHPMAMAAYKELLEKDLVTARQYARQGDLSWEDAQSADKISDRYTMLNVFLSMVLFLGAINAKLSQLKIQLGVTVFSGIICLISILLIAFYMPLAKE